MTTPGASDRGPAHLVDVAVHMVLPTCVLTWWYLAAFARLTRASMLEESRKPYLTTIIEEVKRENWAFAAPTTTSRCIESSGP